MEAPIQQTQVDEGQAEITSAPQATATIEQPQESTVAPVESAQPTSQEPVVGTPEYETARQIKNLMKEIRSLKQSINTRPSETPMPAPQTTQPQVPQVSLADLNADPLTAIRKIVEASNVSVRQQILQEMQEKQSEVQREQLKQEGLKLIRTNELIKRDPEGEERIKEILEEENANGRTLNQYSLFDPIHAAELALEKYQSRYGQNKNGVYAPTKAQMASTATAQSAGGARMTTDAEIASIWAQYQSNPDLAKDTNFMAKMNALIAKSDMEAKIRK